MKYTGLSSNFGIQNPRLISFVAEGAIHIIAIIAV